jgi:hypothetical protein
LAIKQARQRQIGLSERLNERIRGSLQVLSPAGASPASTP